MQKLYELRKGARFLYQGKIYVRGGVEKATDRKGDGTIKCHIEGFPRLTRTLDRWTYIEVL